MDKEGKSIASYSTSSLAPVAISEIEEVGKNAQALIYSRNLRSLPYQLTLILRGKWKFA